MNESKNIKKHRTVRFCLAVFFLALALGSLTQTISSQRKILEIYRDGANEHGKIFYRRFVRQISFKDYTTRVNLIVDHYSRGGFPPPEKFPPHTIEWRALLNITVPGEYRFDVQASGPIALKIAGPTVLDKAGKGCIYLSSGFHDLDLCYINNGISHKGIPHGTVNLMWKCPGAYEWAEIPPGVFSQSEPEPWFNNTGLLSFLSIVSFLIFFILILSERKFVQLHWSGLTIALIVFLGGALRFYQYNIIPVYTETMDEFNLGWMGWSLLKLGVPVGWDCLSGYGNWNSACKFWFGNNLPIVSPAYGSGSLLHIPTGVIAIFSGAEKFMEITLSSIRILPVIFSTATIWLIYYFMKDRIGKCPALLSSLLFAIIPTIVISGRMGKEENTVAFLLLISLILYNKSLDSRRWQKAFPAGVILGLACLAKFTAGSFLPGMIFLYLSRKRWKQAAAVFCAGGVIASFYFVYGAVIDWGMFIRVFNSQRVRVSLLDVMVKMIFHPKITNAVFLDGGVLFLWVSIICTGFLRNKGIVKDIGIVAAVYLLALSVNVDSGNIFGWYKIPLYPLLCAGGGIVLAELFRKKNLLLMAMFIGLAVMINLQYCLPAHFIRSLMFPKLVVAGLLFPILPWQIWKTKFCNSLAVFGIALAVLIYIMTSIMMILRFPGIYYSG